MWYVSIYELGYSDFKYIISLLLRHLFPPCLKMLVVNTNVTIIISNTASSRAIILTNLDSIVDSDTNNVICHLQQHNNSRHF